MSRLSLSLIFILHAAAALADSEQRYHPVVTSLGAQLMPVNPPEETIAWDPQDPDHNVLHSAAIHIAAQQCPDGGFGWPHDDCSATFNNITAPIINGVHRVWQQTGIGAYLGVMQAGGDFDLTSTHNNGEARLATETPLFLWNLTQASKNSVYRAFVESEFFAALDAGTYSPDDRNTAAQIAYVQTARQGTWINLLPWEFKSIPLIAQRHCRPSQAGAFEQALLDGMNTLDSTDPDNVFSDILGVAGGVWGLAATNRLSFPTIAAPNHSGVSGLSSLQQLTDYLVSLQNPDGSWHHHSNLAAPEESDKGVQTTAYAVLALIQANERLSNDYLPAINAGQDWLESMQTPLGGFPRYPGGDENTEVEAEALSALATVGVYDRIFKHGVECYIN